MKQSYHSTLLYLGALAFLLGAVGILFWGDNLETKSADPGDLQVKKEEPKIERLKHLKKWLWGQVPQEAVVVKTPGQKPRQVIPNTSPLSPDKLFRFSAVFLCSDPALSEVVVYEIKSKKEKLLKPGESFQGLKIKAIGKKLHISYQGRDYQIEFKNGEDKDGTKRMKNQWALIDKNKLPNLDLQVADTDTEEKANKRFWRNWQKDVNLRLGNLNPSLKYRDLIGEGRNHLADLLLYLSEEVRG